MTYVARLPLTESVPAFVEKALEAILGLPDPHAPPLSPLACNMMEILPGIGSG